MESYKTTFNNSLDWDEELNLNIHDFILELTPNNPPGWGIRFECEKSFDEGHRSARQFDLVKQADKDFLVFRERGVGDVAIRKASGRGTFSFGIKRAGSVASLTFLDNSEETTELGDFSVVTIRAAHPSPPFELEAVIRKFPKTTMLNQELT